MPEGVQFHDARARAETAGGPGPAAGWRLWQVEPGIPVINLRGELFPTVRIDNLGQGFQEALLGAGYAQACLAKPAWQEGLPPRLAGFFQAKPTRTKFTIITREVLRDDQGNPLPLFTLAKTDAGHGVVVECNPELKGREELYFSLALYSLVQANTAFNRHHFDAYGDFMRLGAFSLVDRHSTEMVRKHLTQRIAFEEEGCTHCLKCVTSCSEMRVGLTPEGLKVLGPAEDYCTTCRLCLNHCPRLLEVRKEDLPPEERAAPELHFTGGEATYVAGPAAREFSDFLEQLTESGGRLDHWHLSQVFQGDAFDGSELHGGGLISHYGLEDRRPESPLKPLLITVFQSPLQGAAAPLVILRRQVRVAVWLTTETGEIEADLIRSLEGLGVLYQGVIDQDRWGGGGAHTLVPRLFRLGRLARESDPCALVQAGQVDVFISPRRQAIPAAVQSYFLKRTGNLAQVLAPQLFQAFTLSHDPLLNELRDICLEVFYSYPELLAAEVEQARTYLADLPRYTQEIHAAYRTWGLASGHSACPTCAEISTLAVPLYIAMLLSLARGQVPQVSFTCETGCMSETLNKVNEVAQKVKGGRTVFGGGFAFAEAAAMSEDWAISRGLLRPGRRYVVSQSGDGGSVIGLPAWLNALRQRAFLIKDREARVLHFINVTDTQVYSNTGGESSASSMLGMSTLTTPLGRFLVGNQRIQWQLINLAAEFPGILVGQGHSANKLAMQEFWAEADALGRSAIRWDVTPCPETGKFFGEDPDDLARVMAHAGMLPEFVLVGRLRKRVAPINPGDRRKNWREWCSEPQPIYYWLSQDPRYRPLIRQDPVTEGWEPTNPAVRFIICQLERLRDSLNRQIDLETRLVREAEEYSAEFFHHLQEEWWKTRHVPEEFPYHFLFNEAGELKPEFGPSFQRDFLEAILGQDYVVEYAVKRDQGWVQDSQNLEAALVAGEEVVLLGAEFLPPPLRFTGICPPGADEGHESLAAARRAEFYRVLDRLLDERSLARAAQMSQYVLKKELSRDFVRQGGMFTHRPISQALTSRQEFRAALSGLGDFAIGVASLAGDRGIAINRVFSHLFTAKGAWTGMAWQFGSSKRGTPVFSGTFVSHRPIARKDAILSFPFYVLTVTNYGDLKNTPDIFYNNLAPRGFLIINTPKSPEDIHQELLARYDESTQRAVAQARAAPVAGAREEVSQALFDTAFSALGPEQQQHVRKVLALARAQVITTDMDGIMAQVAGTTKVVSNLVAVAPMVRALENLGLPVSLDVDRKDLVAGFPGAVTKKKKLLSQYLEAMRRAYEESQGFPEVPASPGGQVILPSEATAADPGDYYLEMGGTLAGMVMSQLATARHPLFYVGFPITPAGNPFYAMAQAFANGHPYIMVDENNPSEKVAAEKLLGVARTGGALPVTFTASQGWRLFAEIMPQLVGARLECIFVLCRRALAAPALNIEESHTDFMTFRDDGAIMLSPKSIQEFVPCLYLARLLTHWSRLPVVASLGGITDTHKINLVKVPADRQVQAWLERWLGDYDFLEDKLLNRQGEVIVHGPSATNEHYQETQSEVEKAHALSRRVYPLAVQAVAELTGYRFEELEVTVAAPEEPLRHALVLTGSFYPNAEEAVVELAREGWRELGAVSVRLFNPFPETELAEVLSDAQVVTILDRSNSFGDVPPLASRVITAIGRQWHSPPPVFRLVVGGLGGREITVAQLKEIIKFSALCLTPRPGVESWRKQILDEDPLLPALLRELVALEARNWKRHTRLPRDGWPAESVFDAERFQAEWQDCLLRGDYVKFLANYGQVEFLEAKEVWEETRLRKQLLIRLEKLLSRALIGQGRGDWRAAATLLEYGVSAGDFQLAIEALENLISTAPPEAAWNLYRLGEGYRHKYLPLGLSLSEPSSPAPAVPSRTPEVMETWEPPETVPVLPEVPFSKTEAARLREIIRRLVAQTSSQETLAHPEDLERQALRLLEADPESHYASLADEDQGQAYQGTYSGVIDRAIWEETLTQHYAPELAEIFGGEGVSALKLVARAVAGYYIQAASDHTIFDAVEKQKQTKEEIAREAALEVERYLREEVYPGYRRTPGFYHDFYRTWVEPEIRQFIHRELTEAFSL